MLLTCEQCQTIFRIDDSAIAATGQQVRCSVCQHVWHVEPHQPVSDDSNRLLGDVLKRLRLPALTLIMIAAICTIIYAFRGPLTAAHPQLLSAYQFIGLSISPNLSVLQVENLSADYERNILRIRGQLKNNYHLTSHASALEIKILSQTGEILAIERMVPEDKVIEAGQTTAFFLQVDIDNATDAQVVVTPISQNIISR